MKYYERTTGTRILRKLESQFQDYINNRIWLVKLEATEKAARLSSLALILLVLAGLAFFVLFSSALWRVIFSQN